jgi:hypothetical protein
VYASTALLSADEATLRSLVPAGCALRGVRTSYADVRTRPAGTERAAVTATVRVAASVLDCPGQLPRTAVAAGPTRLRIELVRTFAGIRIVRVSRIAHS